MLFPAENLKFEVIAGLPKGYKAVATVLEKKDIEQDDNYESIQSKCITYDLTKAEQKVIKLILKFYSIKEIADKLCVCPGTIRVHLQHIREKCYIEETYQLIRFFNN